MVNDDNGEPKLSGILSKDYNLIKNSAAKDIGDNIKSRSDYLWEELKCFWDGKKYAHYYISTEPVTEIENGGTHPIHLGIMLRNSYDGSSCFGLEIFACNMQCANQYISRNRFGFFAIKHTDNEAINIEDAVTNIGIGAQRLIEVAPKIGELRHKALSVDDIRSAKKNTSIPNSRWGDVIDKLGDGESNKFGLFQAMTNVASHKMTGFNSITVGNTITEHFLSTR